MIAKAHLSWALRSFNDTGQYTFQKVVLLVRHPLDAMVSERKRRVARKVVERAQSAAALASLPSSVVPDAPLLVRRSNGGHAQDAAAAALAAHVLTPSWTDFVGSELNQTAWAVWTVREIRAWTNTLKFAYSLVPSGIPVLVVRWGMRSPWVSLALLTAALWACALRRFEDLRRDPRRELERVLHFLGAVRP